MRHRSRKNGYHRRDRRNQTLRRTERQKPERTYSDGLNLSDRKAAQKLYGGTPNEL